MDSFFGIGFPELVMILILAGLVLGPQKIRQVARTLGRFVAQMQSISRQFTRQLNAELDAALDAEEMKGTLDDVKALQREVTDLRRQVSSLTDEAVAEGRKALEEGEKIFQGREVPPPEADLPAGRPFVPCPVAPGQSASRRASCSSIRASSAAGSHSGASKTASVSTQPSGRSDWR